MAFGSRPDPQTLEVGAEAEGQVLGAGSYKVAPLLAARMTKARFGGPNQRIRFASR